MKNQVTMLNDRSYNELSTLNVAELDERLAIEELESRLEMACPTAPVGITCSPNSGGCGCNSDSWY